MHLTDVSRAWLAVLALVVVVVLLVQRTWLRWSARRRLSRRMRRARRAELAAPRWLQEHGYAMIGGQVASTYTLAIDGEEVAVQVRADYVVEREGARYVAEVKSGQAAPNIQTQATRRQLLEYRMAFDVDGVLLVDAETERVHVVRFPVASPEAVSRTGFGWAAAALILGLCVLVIALR